jgi:hypothetical protein
MLHTPPLRVVLVLLGSVCFWGHQPSPAAIGVLNPRGHVIFVRLEISRGVGLGFVLDFLGLVLF